MPPLILEREKMEVVKRMEELKEKLNAASRAYYAEDRELMSNVEYDALYDELLALEKESGIVLSDSPSQRVGYEAVDFLPKERHASPMLSLDKTKSREELAAWLKDREGLLSWKEDGLTVVLSYSGGSLKKCVTRGNGEVGEVVTANARAFKNLPLTIPYQGELIVRGEAVIGYKDFEEINARLKQTEVKYKNPRNLCSGSVRQLDAAVTADRNVQVIIFSLVRAEGEDFDHSMEKQFAFLKTLGFTVVEYERVNAKNVVDAVARFEARIAENDIPSDGLVLSYDDLAYAASLGSTAKFPRGAIAFKWADEMAETELLSVEWNTSRTGLINPVAVFESVELEGTSVSRASAHNVSVIRQLKLGIGDRLKVYKANMIIPQIAENLTKSDTLKLPDKCPVCGAPARLCMDADSEVLRCENEECPARQLKSFVHFVERDAMNIDGLSEATLEKLIAAGLIKSFADIYRLDDQRDKILALDGFLDKATDKLLSAVGVSRKSNLPRLLNALGIPGVGVANARSIALSFKQDVSALRAADRDELAQIDGVGAVMAADIYAYLHDERKAAALDELLAELVLEKIDAPAEDAPLAGKSFAVTGGLTHFENRNALKAQIERLGGKLAGSVSAKCECLINNDAASASSKNKSAQALGVKILTEEAFISEYLSSGASDAGAVGQPADLV